MKISKLVTALIFRKRTRVLTRVTKFTAPKAA